MKSLHENTLRQHHSAAAIHFDEKIIRSSKRKRIFTAKNCKIAILTLVWLTTTVIFIIKPEYPLKYFHSDVPPQFDKIFRIGKNIQYPRLDVYLKGAFSEIDTESKLTLYAAVNNGTTVKQISEKYHFSLVQEKKIETSDSKSVSAVIMLTDLSNNENSDFQLILRTTNCSITFAMSLAYQSKPLNVEVGIGFGAAVLIGLYILIIFEVVDRTFAALIAANLSIAALALFNERPDLEEIIAWIDMDTLMLLFGMMILVAITSETGVFDFMAVYVFKKTRGKVWPLICSLSIITMVAALFLDSVSTILLITPVVIRICEVTNLNPVPVLTIIILAVNIGSIASPVGNPPNVMIINDDFIQKSGVGFLDFILHTLPGVVVLTVQSYFQIRFLTFKKTATLQNEESLQISNIKHELRMWESTDRSISAISKFDDISRSVIHSRVALLNEALQRELESSHSNRSNQCNRNHSVYFEDVRAAHPSVEAGIEDSSDKKHDDMIQHLEEMYPIKNKQLLTHCGIVFAVVICFFFLHAAPFFNVSLGWTSLLGVCLLLIISNNEDIKTCLLMVEWASLLFFATLFVLMESLTKIGLIKFIGEKLSDLVKLAAPENQMLVAVLLVLWVSTIISAFLDNIPLTSMMIKVIITLSTSLKLTINPMVWALAFGCGIGGNGTLIASSANLVCIGVAEQHGYKFSFMKFFKVGFPLMIVNGLIVSIYLGVFHVLIKWY